MAVLDELHTDSHGSVAIVSSALSVARQSMDGVERGGRDMADEFVIRPGRDGLLFLAGGDPSGQLSVHEEFEAIVAVAGVHDSRAKLEWLPAGDLAQVVRALSMSSATVVHYAGVSTTEGLSLTGDPLHAGAPVHPQTLRRALERGSRRVPIQLLFFNTCYSPSLVPTMLEPPPIASFVVANIGKCDDRAAVAFARHFYSRLFEGMTLRSAFDHASSDASSSVGSSGDYRLWMPASSR